MPRESAWEESKEELTTATRRTAQEPSSILEQWEAEELADQHTMDAGIFTAHGAEEEDDHFVMPSFHELSAFTADVIVDELNGFESRIEEMALDVGIAIDNLNSRGDMDVLYMTSVAFLLVLTVAIVSAIASYKQSKCQLRFSTTREGYELQELCL